MLRNNDSARFAWLTGVIVAILASLGLRAAERVLLDFSAPIDAARVQPTDATTTRTEVDGRPVWRLTTGHQQSWPGVTVTAPNGSWDLAEFGFVLLRVGNSGSQPVTVSLRVDNAGADGKQNCLNGSVSVQPGAVGDVRIELKRESGDKLGGRLFALRGYPVKAGGDGTIDPARVNQVVVFVNQPKVDHQIDLVELRAGGAYVRPTAWTTDADPYFPLIDTFGQYRHRDWPGKTHNLDTLRAAQRAEGERLSKDSGPADWDRFGGWSAGPKRDATGFFRVEKVDGRWWLVDPDGRLFWSAGVDCVQSFDATPIAGREDWFEAPPWNEPAFAGLRRPQFALLGNYAGKSPEAFAFALANLERKYGVEWRASVPEVIHRRLRSWGLNTIGNWSDLGVARLRHTPYTDAVSSDRARSIEGSEGYWGKFPDVFDPSFAERLRRSMATKQGGSAGDPWCLGYFSDNEMSWGDDVSLAVAVLVSPADQPAKQAFLADLKARYGEIAELNAAWGTSHESWETLATGRAKPDLARAGSDLRTFYSRAAETYFRTVRDVIRETAPHQLYLGCRFAWANERAAAAAAKFCDVVSYNLYQRSVADFHPAGAGDVPLLIGEFHFGALDRGMFHTGLVPVGDQAARAAAGPGFVTGALPPPQVLGWPGFEYNVEPVAGGVYDEENYQIGLVDVADTPYAETVAALRTVGDTLYRTRSGR